jgi:flagellum-specific ATP synthase
MADGLTGDGRGNWRSHPAVTLPQGRHEQLARHLSALRHRILPPPVVVEGKLARVAGMTLEAVGCEAALGGRCLIDSQGREPVEAEVVGFSGDRLFLMPTGTLAGVMPAHRGPGRRGRCPPRPGH